MIENIIIIEMTIVMVFSVINNGISIYYKFDR